MNLRALGAALALAVLLVPVRTAAADSGVDPGQAIYRDGVLGSGAALEASRSAGARVEGAAAACVNCHRRSGLGAREGRSVVPPITGRYLFRPNPKDGDDRGIPFVEGMRGEREPYTDETLARAIREGLDSQGKPLSYLMPHYALGDADMAALVGYLKRLDQRRVPGVSDTTLHFATIITPDADPVKRRAMLDVMKQFFADRNARQMPPAPRLLASGKTSPSRTMFMVHRQWELHVWELTGPESSWQQQLDKHLAAEPVFAIVSGVGGRNWAPVHAFCEEARVPCLFPNVEAPPPSADRDFYTIYFSRGVLLEADLLAQQLADPSARGPAGKVRQVYRAGDVGEAGASALEAALRQKGMATSRRVIAAGQPATEGLAAALRALADDEVLVLWLRPADLQALPPGGRAPVSLYVSGLMGGLERAPLPPAWRDAARMAYPFDLPEARRVRVDFALGWFRIRNIPVVAEQVQADTYLACGLLSETVTHLVDTFVREYLIERVEDTLEHRIVTGFYPRLTLSTGQRFASKGGYVLRLADIAKALPAADRQWRVP